MSLNPFPQIRRILWRIYDFLGEMREINKLRHHEVRARLELLDLEVKQVLDLLRGKPVVSLGLSVGEPVDIKPPYQKMRVAGFDSHGPMGASPYSKHVEEEDSLLRLCSSPGGRAKLTVAMRAPFSTDALLQFCRANTWNDLFVGESLLWVRRLLARAANVRSD